MHRRQLLRGMSALAIAASLAGCRPAAPAFHATDLGRSGLSGELPANFRDFHGRPWHLADFRGRIVLLFFGYTTCPDVCPTALAKYAGLLAQPGLGPDRVQVVFVTLDPERDTPARLAGYVPWFHPSFLGLHADPATTAAAARAFRVTAIRRESASGTGYTLDHSAGAYVFDPRGRLRLHVAENARMAEIVADLQTLLAEDAR